VEKQCCKNSAACRWQKCLYILLRSMHSLCQRLNGRDSPCWDAHQWLWCAWLRQIVTHMEQCMIQPQPAVGRDWRESVT
jgi:hypothetical protein